MPNSSQQRAGGLFSSPQDASPWGKAKCFFCPRERTSQQKHLRIGVARENILKVCKVGGEILAHVTLQLELLLNHLMSSEVTARPGNVWLEK